MRDRDLGERTFSHGTSITTQLSTLLKNVTMHARQRGYEEKKIGRRHITSNLQWHRNVGIIDFMQIAGHRSRIGEMMLRKSVSERLKSPEGLSYSEFSYQLIQAMDYWHLFSNLGVRLQIGGSDQWGNITAGCDLINKMVNEAAWIDDQPTPSLIKSITKPYGLTVPLLTTQSGEKFSKSTGAGNIWISPNKTPPFALYQYLLNRPDEVMEQWLKYFTLLPLPEIAEIINQQKESPEKRPAQKKLAYEMISLLHGAAIANKCIETTTIFFGSDEPGSAEQRRLKLQAGLDKSDIKGVSPRPFWEPVLAESIMGLPLEKALVAGGVSPSNSQARTLLKSGAVSIGPHLRQIKLADEKIILTPEDLIDENILLIKVGKNKLHIIRLQTPESMKVALEEKEDPEWAMDPSREAKPDPKTPGQKKSIRRREKKATAQARLAAKVAAKRTARNLEQEKIRAEGQLLGEQEHDFTNLLQKALDREEAKALRQRGAGKVIADQVKFEGLELDRKPKSS
ncbi:tyrosyl-tRNA synthetase [Arthrobotrys musiformis]|uniref:Tyrosine--tRNA ligase n=1 Tax=Arthrobotrys musiformis TaxID=47236 RepID=A0AAV9W5G7_9PEZI